MLSQGKCDKAEPLYERCQAIQEKVLGLEHPSLATTLHNRATLFVQQVRAVRRDLEISEREGVCKILCTVIGYHVCDAYAFS